MDKRQDQVMALAGRLARLQQTVSEAEGKTLSDSDFAKRYMPFSTSTFSRIKSGDEAKAKGLNLDHISEQIQQAEDDVAERLTAIMMAADADSVFVPTKLACATQASIKRARDSKGRRVVVLLARTGAGKSAVGEALSAKGAIYIEGRQSWKKSYKAFCADVARAAGRPLKVKRYTEHDAEERMLQALRSRDAVLYLDEANTLGPESVNAIKLIVNMTGTVVVIAAIPKMWDKLYEGAEEEVAQLVNRCQPILRDKGLSEEDVRPFLMRSGLSAADIDQCVGQVVEASNEFGLLKTVVALVDEMKKKDGPTAADVEGYLRFHKKNTAKPVAKKEVSK